MKKFKLVGLFLSFLLICVLAVLVLKPEIATAQDILHSDDTKTLSKEITRLSIKYEVDEVLASKIIQCESNFNPRATNVNNNKTIDYSYWQLNNFYWSNGLSSLGWDITNPDDNLEAGFYLLNKYGSKLWIWSKPCWSK